MIETERLILRPPRLEDVDDFAVAYADPEVMRYLGDGSTATREEVAQVIERSLERWNANGMGLFAMESRETGRVVGRSGFLVWDSEGWTVANLADAGDRAEIELGWMVARESWGRGYATEAALALREWAVAERGLTRLISLIRPGNMRSIRVAEKIGETFEREIVMTERPSLMYSLKA
ncbi:MAG TPA: GNAT family N-acetyltransferase [Gaiellaceae bacterium]